jgi:solute carrier family 25 carnitine/acylcarnitine transporter 20/29
MSDSNHQKALKNDSFAGFCGAVAKIIVGHPLETIKVRMQSSSSVVPKSTPAAVPLVRSLSTATATVAPFVPVSPSPFRTVFKMYRLDGIRGFYRGVLPTIPSLALYNSTLFASFGYILDRVHVKNEPYSASNVAFAAVSPLTFGELMLILFVQAGAGLCCSLITAPLELVRTRMQANRTGLLQTSAQILTKGGIGGFYRGVSLMIAREMPANVLYFLTYEMILSSAGYSMHDSNRFHAAPATLVFFAGGAAGIANWMFVFPIDTLKTRYQADDLSKPRYTNMKTLLLSSNRRGLFNGYSACLGRAFFANAAAFLATEAYRSLL